MFDNKQSGPLDEYDLCLLEAATSGLTSIENMSAEGRVPKSTAYRRVPVLADRGLLRSERRDSGVGRPALVYVITDSGVEELRAYTERLRQTAERVSAVVAGLSRRESVNGS